MRSPGIILNMIVLLSLSSACMSGNEGGHAKSATANEPGAQLQGETLIMHRVWEPRENAFSLLIPKGWSYTGGIYRLDPSTSGGAGNAIEAKLDFSVFSDKQGSVMIRWLPDMYYFDMSRSPAGQMGLFPTGSNYNGMTVIPRMNAALFTENIVIPYIHPGLQGISITERKNAPDVARMIMNQDKYMMANFIYDAAITTLTYRENGIEYQEKIVTVVMDFGDLGAGLWKNRSTFYARAPKGQFENYEPIFGEIINSVKINMNWLIGEIRGQVQRNQIHQDVLNTIQRMDKEIAEHQRKTNYEINNDMFLTLTEQEEYVNPYTNEVEVGSNQWQYRWVNQDNEVVYSNNQDYNPNMDDLINRNDFKLTPVRERKISH